LISLIPLTCTDGEPAEALPPPPRPPFLRKVTEAQLQADKDEIAELMKYAPNGEEDDASEDGDKQPESKETEPLGPDSTVELAANNTEKWEEWAAASRKAAAAGDPRRVEPLLLKKTSVATPQVLLIDDEEDSAILTKGPTDEAYEAMEDGGVGGPEDGGLIVAEDHMHSS
jgi:hypothetical protein